MTSQSGVPGIKGSTRAALEALRLGRQPIPIQGRGKRPHLSSWEQTRWQQDNPDALREAFERWNSEGATNIGLLLGEPSGGLIDVDIDHPVADRLRANLLPQTAMKTGRVGRPVSHCWYQIEKWDVPGNLPETRRFKMPDGEVSVELRSTRAQTVIPPSIHPSGDRYRWEGQPWGGKQGPAVVDGRALRVQVAYLAMCTVLLENWPLKGSRHEAYLALAGGFLRYGQGVHPYWERNLPMVIDALADATHDDDVDARVSETMKSTLAKLRSGGKVTGFPSLAEIIGEAHVEQVRRVKRDVETYGGHQPTEHEREEESQPRFDFEDDKGDKPPMEWRGPLGVGNSWKAVDLDPYIAGEVEVAAPKLLKRSDGQGLVYQGRVNLLFGPSESAKSWIALIACRQEIDSANGQVLYLDFEDEPAMTLLRLRALGVGDDDIRSRFTYVHPETPHQDMNKNRFTGQARLGGNAEASKKMLALVMEKVEPTLIVVDGMTVLYGLHGLDTNDAASADIVATWLKELTQHNKLTVLGIDHTGKNLDTSSPIGAHHKIAMVQGTALQTRVRIQPMPTSYGEVELILVKDRPGEVRRASTPEGKQPEKRPVVAVVKLDSRVTGATGWSIELPSPDEITVAVSDKAIKGAAQEDARRAKKTAEDDQRRADADRLATLERSLLIERIMACFRSSEWLERHQITDRMILAHPDEYSEKDHNWRFKNIVKDMVGVQLRTRGNSPRLEYALMSSD